MSKNIFKDCDSNNVTKAPRCDICNRVSTNRLCIVCKKHAERGIYDFDKSEQIRSAVRSVPKREPGDEDFSDVDLTPPTQALSSSSDSVSISSDNETDFQEEKHDLSPGTCDSIRRATVPARLNPLKKTIAFWDRPDSPDSPPAEDDDQVVTYSLCGQCAECNLSNGFHLASCSSYNADRERELSVPFASNEAILNLSKVCDLERGSDGKLKVASIAGPDIELGCSSRGEARGWEPPPPLPCYPAFEVLYPSCEVCGFCWQATWELSTREEHVQLSKVRHEGRELSCPQCGRGSLDTQTRFFFKFGCPYGEEWLNFGADQPGISSSGDDALSEDCELLCMDESLGPEEESITVEWCGSGSDRSFSDSGDSGVDQFEREENPFFQASPTDGDWSTEHGEDWLDRALECLSFHILHSNGGGLSE